MAWPDQSSNSGVMGGPKDVMRYMNTRKTGRAKSKRSGGGGGGGNSAGRQLFQRTMSRASGRK